MNILKPLSDVEVKEGQTAIMECTVSKPNLKSTWERDDTPLEADDRITMTTEGQVHTLTITNAVVDDEADYKVKVMDQFSSASVFVEGKFEVTHQVRYVHMYLAQVRNILSYEVHVKRK